MTTRAECVFTCFLTCQLTASDRVFIARASREHGKEHRRRVLSSAPLRSHSVKTRRQTIRPSQECTRLQSPPAMRDVTLRKCPARPLYPASIYQSSTGSPRSVALLSHATLCRRSVSTRFDAARTLLRGRHLIKLTQKCPPALFSS